MVTVCRSVLAAITGFHSKGLMNWADMGLRTNKVSCFLPFAYEVAQDGINLMEELGGPLADGYEQLINAAFTAGSGSGQLPASSQAASVRLAPSQWGGASHRRNVCVDRYLQRAECVAAGVSGQCSVVLESELDQRREAIRDVENCADIPFAAG
jgi:hypothetical protein